MSASPLIPSAAHEEFLEHDCREHDRRAHGYREHGGLAHGGLQHGGLAHGSGRVRVLRSTDPPADPDAPPLLLIHGGGADQAAISWFEMFEAFGPQRTVIALDLPGFGRTTVEPVGGAAEQARCVVSVARRLGIARAVVVGVSMGGDVAMHVALRDPDLVEALVLVAPGGLVPVYRSTGANLLAWAFAQLPDRLMDPLVAWANRHIDRAVRAMVHDVAALPPQVRAEFAAEAARRPLGMGYRRYNQANLAPTRMRNDLTPRVRAITAPTLFFHGRLDGLVPPSGSVGAALRMPDARVVLVEDCGHWAQLEAGARFRVELTAFLDGLPR